ncbi:MAG: hypothetical protein ACJ76H_02630 [Bacteriovoracaceae bacterium]
MKTKWSAILSLLFFTMLTGCGNEQFGTGGQSANSNANPLTTYENQSCSNFTLIKPKVDVVYVVDNSASSYYLASDIKNALRNTVDTLSSDFDYRVIGTPLIETSSGNQDYQVMTNSSDLAGLPGAPKRIQTSSDFTFFSNPGGGGYERGLNRAYSFVSFHKSSGLIRSNAHTIVVLVSNGRDADVEAQGPFGNGETIYNASNFASALSQMKSLKNANYQLRFVSATAHSECKSGWFSSLKSYVQMSGEIYNYSGATDQSDSTPDAYDLCGSGFTSIFSSINSSIKQVLIAHGYRFWPISFLNNTDNNVDQSKITVTKVSSDGSKSVLTKDTDWTFVDEGSAMSINTREVPTPGEPYNGRYFIRFSNLLMYPDCVLVTSVSKTEYFDWVVLPKKPLLPVTVKVNGVEIPQSAMSTSQVNTSQTLNIKAGYPTTADENPPVMRTGFMIQITNPQYYYKSGDNVETLYTPAGI